MNIFDKFQEIENKINKWNIKTLFEKNNMTIVHSGGGCFHLSIDDDYLCNCDDSNVKNCICEKDWIINAYVDDDCDVSFENKITLDTICMTSTSCSDDFYYLDSFENIINRIKNGDLGQRVKIHKLNSDKSSVFYTGDK